jgi:thiol-disulfide isomerase/thioredoxin/outer membrane lipoprotein-sorting protein
MLIRVFAMTTMLVNLCWAQASGSAAPSLGGLALLQQAGERYRNANSYDIEEVQEKTSTTELRRLWEKTASKAIQEPANRYHYESHTPDGSRIHLSDGKTEWIYDPEDNAYTQHPASADGPATSPTMFPADLAEFNVRKLRQELADLGTDYSTAANLPEETITVGEKPVECYVVKVSSQNLSSKDLRSIESGSNDPKPSPTPGISFEKTIWIAKSDHSIRKIVTRQHSPMPMAPAIFEDLDITETYPVVVLDSQLPADIFAFPPPQRATLVAELPNPLQPPNEENPLNKPAPDVKLKSLDGNEVSLASFRGKPLLIDFWATWCGPCVAALPQLTVLYQQLKEKGVAFIGVNEDEDAKTAADFVAKKNLPWPNFHDGGEIAGAFHQKGLPLIVLIDAEGKIVLYQAGYSNNEAADLRTAIAKLGPEYAVRPSASQ